MDSGRQWVAINISCIYVSQKKHPIKMKWKKQPEETLEQAGWGGGERGMTIGREGRHSATTFLFFL